MSTADSYTRTGRFAERGGVVVDRAIDPITGLPVLVYRFDGVPVEGARTLQGEDVWPVLDAGADDRGGYVVSHLVDGAEPIEGRPASLDDHVAERAFRALVAAAQRGVTHGDLGPHRVYRRGDRVWIEGYGVPWAADGDGGASDGASARSAADARALAQGLLALPGHALSKRASSVLGQAASDGDAAAAHAALAASASAAAATAAVAERATPVERVVASTTAPAAPSRPPRNAASAAFHDVRLEGAPDVAPTRPAAAAPRPTPSTSPGSTSAGSTSPGPTSAGPTGPASPAPSPPRSVPPSGGPRFSKALPPDVTYRSGSEAPPERDLGDHVAAVVTSVRDRRRVWLLGILVVAALALALITLGGGREVATADPTPGAGAAAATFVVDVRVTPSTLPPVSLVVVSSPAGSRHGVNTVIRSVPDRVVLDREGTWQLQGRFEDRRSEIVTLTVPRDTVITLPFPVAP